MAIKADYVLRETGGNLLRNFTLTIATILTVLVSLALFGAALTIGYRVDNLTERWKGGIEFIVYMSPEASPEQLASVRTSLDENPLVDDFSFVDKDATFEEFKELFRDSPAILESVTPENMPPSYRVVPSTDDPDTISALGDTFQGRPGVLEVAFAYETIKRFQGFTERVNRLILSASVALLVSALLLIVNTIRMAMFARRREIEVMKLVGATNWFIRVPFMLEGLVQGLLGSAGAIVAVTFLNRWFDVEFGATGSNIAIFEAFVISSSELTFVHGLLLAMGSLLGISASAIAVTRFLDV